MLAVFEDYISNFVTSFAELCSKLGTTLSTESYYEAAVMCGSGFAIYLIGYFFKLLRRILSWKNVK